MKRRSKNPKSPRPPAGIRPPNNPGSSAAPGLTQGRKWLFRFIALVLAPTLMLGALEVTLRLAGYGHATGLFREVTIGQREFLVNDDEFSMRFFPVEMTRSPSALRLEPKKPAGTYRIFIFGESAAMGDPEPSFGASRYLEMLLRERFSGQKFEVVNLGITAINSHVIVPIAREAARREGDLWIIYMGNNEMVGPYGAATVFGAQAPPLIFVRASLAIQESRVGQLLMALGRKLRSAKSQTWGGMQMFVENKVPPNDPRKEIVYHNFQRNLSDIVRAGLGSGAQVLLSTVAVDLKDSPPFASTALTNLPPADRTPFEESSHEASFEEQRGDFAKASEYWTRAATMAPQSADAQFGIGNCQLRLGNNATARTRFQQACDLDALPFRADSRINGIITQAGQKFADRGLRVFDAAAALETNIPAEICGLETFYEHVHFNFDGNYRLARAWAAEVLQMMPAAMTNRGAPDWATQEVCEARLGLTDWNRVAVMESVMRRMYEPPLSTQANNAQRIAALQSRISELRAHMGSEAAAKARAIYEDAIKRAPDDYYLHENLAGFLAFRGELTEASAEWQRVHELMPQDFVADYQFGKLLEEQNKLPEAEAILSHSVAAHPGFTEGWMELAKIHAAQAKLELARDEYERARRLRPQDPATPYQLGMVLSRLNRSAESVQSFREALRLRPDYWEAHYTLGGELGMHDQITEARKEFEEVIRLNPNFAGAHLNLGVALMKQGHLDDAQQQFQETLRIEPGNAIAPDYLRQLQALKSHAH